jgi:hypothetical protein
MASERTKTVSIPDPNNGVATAAELPRVASMPAPWQLHLP